jgi:hypothetical protein
MLTKGQNGKRDVSTWAWVGGMGDLSFLLIINLRNTAEEILLVINSRRSLYSALWLINQKKITTINTK